LRGRPTTPRIKSNALPHTTTNNQQPPPPTTISKTKGAWVFYTELMTDMLHLLVYVVFFVIVFTHYGLPLHLVRAGGVEGG
jgi:hypothetical protein